MARRASLRASDADRDRIAERLRQAAAEGRILAQELEERLATALRARTYGELDALVSDLPPTRPSRRRRGTRQVLLAQPAGVLAALAAVTLVAFVIAAVVLAAAFALSGAWTLLALVVFARGGARRCGLGPRRRGLGRPLGS